MGAISTFHTKAVAESQAKAESAKDERDRASRFLRELDEVLSEGFNEVAETS